MTIIIQINMKMNNMSIGMRFVFSSQTFVSPSVFLIHLKCHFLTEEIWYSCFFFTTGIGFLSKNIVFKQYVHCFILSMIYYNDHCGWAHVVSAAVQI